MKAKKAVLFIIIVLLLIIGVLLIIYYKTDIFKTTSQKFWKYANTNSEISNLYNSDDIQSIKNRRSNNPYEVNSRLAINKNNSSYILTTNSNAQNANDITTFVEFQYNDRDIMDCSLVKRSNLIAIKMDELANGYIALKNNDIQALATDAGIEDVSNIPKNINWLSLFDLLYISKNDEKYFTSTYSDLILKNTNKENYSKEESGIKVDDKIHAAVGYKLNLSENETKHVVKAILNNLKNDDSRATNFILSKLKLLNMPDKYANHDAIVNYISKMIEQVDSIETTDDEFIEIIVYVENGEVIQTNLKIKDDSVIKFTFNRENNSINIRQESSNKTLENSSNEILKYLANLQELNLSNEVSEDKNSVITKFYSKFYNNIIIEYNSKIGIVDSIEKNTDFEDGSKIVLNELEGNNLKKLYGLIKDQIPIIYEEKKNLLNNNDVYVDESGTVVESSDNN